MVPHILRWPWQSAKHDMSEPFLSLDNHDAHPDWHAPALTHGPTITYLRACIFSGGPPSKGDDVWGDPRQIS